LKAKTDFRLNILNLKLPSTIEIVGRNSANYRISLILMAKTGDLADSSEVYFEGRNRIVFKEKSALVFTGRISYPFRETTVQDYRWGRAQRQPQILDM
jgi:hypothetical protein